MKIEEALKWIDNAIDYWAEESDYDEKEEDIKKTDEAWTVMVKALKEKEKIMTDKQLEEKAVDLMNLFLSFCDDSEVEKYIDVENERRSESGEYLLAAIKKWLKDNVIEVEWEGEKSRLWTPWTKR